MELERWLDNTIRIQSIPAPTFDEAERAAFLRDALASLGLADVTQDDLHNVYARIPGGSPKPLIISAHLDTVFPLETNLTHRRREAMLFGPGIGDNAIAIGALLELAHDLQQTDLPNDIWLIGNVCEEGLGNLRGMREVVDRFGESVLAYLVLEGMALGHVYHRGLPIQRYRIELDTPGGHAWIHAGRPSAIHALCQLAAGVANLRPATESRWSINIGHILGGTSINTIAPHASMDIDIRAEDVKVLHELENELSQAIGNVISSELKGEMTQIGHRPAGEIPADHPLVEAACLALRSAGVEDCRLEIGSTDASMPLSRGIPAVCIGMTYGSGAHSLEECIEIGPLTQGYQALRQTITACFNLEG